MKGWNRRVTIAMGALSLIAIHALAAETAADEKLIYRGFVVDMSAIRNSANFAAIENSVKHQLDIVADCGAKPEIIDFFRSRRIALVLGLKNPPGQFTSDRGVEIEAGVLPQERPIILHELLHAYHFYVLSGGFRNSDVLQYYENAKARYPKDENHGGRRVPTYLFTDPAEFFAVTASVYLWGYVDREPHDRERLKTMQPYYYDWLGQQFGVHK